jgi:RNA polymerase sigma factor (sigma-70 family)
VEHAHWPFVHCSPPVQAAPHAPQLAGSVCKSTQALLQLVRVESASAVHVSTHAPLMQLGVAAGQECPQEPQLPGSSLRLVQVPSQLASGEQLPPSMAVDTTPLPSGRVLSGRPTWLTSPELLSAEPVVASRPPSLPNDESMPEPSPSCAASCDGAESSPACPLPEASPGTSASLSRSEVLPPHPAASIKAAPSKIFLFTLRAPAGAGPAIGQSPRFTPSARGVAEPITGARKKSKPGRSVPVILFPMRMPLCLRVMSDRELAQSQPASERVAAADATARGAALALARLAGAGDARATRRLLEQVAPRVVGAARAVMGRGHPDLEDAVQLALIGFVQALASFRGECDPAQFAARIAVRTAGATRRRARARSGQQDPSVDLSAIEASTPEAGGERRRAVLRRLLDDLADEQAEALALRVVLGWSLDEIAAATGAPLNTVRSRLRLGKEALRRRIADTPGLADELDSTEA